MEYCLLASSSKGNAFWVRSQGVSLLIDAGMPMRLLKDFFDAQGVGALDLLFITHEHGDHNKNADKVMQEWGARLVVGDTITGDAEQSRFEVGLIEIPHDKETFGCVVWSHQKKLVFLSDMGSFTKDILHACESADVLCLESNYCPKMLKDGPYPDFVQERVRSSRGHLSNQQCAFFLSLLLERGALPKHVVVTHVSENNNSQEEVRKSLQFLEGEVGVDIQPIGEVFSI